MAESNEIGIAFVNANNPNEPEFGKGYKPYLNFGCCGSCGETNCQKNPVPAASRTITQKLTREDFQ